MIEHQRGGKIINICSLAAHKAMPTFSVYGPIKAAVAQLTNSLANEFGPYNIQANSIFPGWVTICYSSIWKRNWQNSWIDTPLAARFINDKPTNDRITSSIPARRWGKPSDFRGITVFLASAASNYVNGARIFVDGGAHGM